MRKVFVFFVVVQAQLAIHLGENEFESLGHFMYKVNSRKIQNLNVRMKTKILEENLGFYM